MGELGVGLDSQLGFVVAGQNGLCANKEVLNLGRHRRAGAWLVDRLRIYEIKHMIKVFYDCAAM
jgi:hypothetical protein